MVNLTTHKADKEPDMKSLVKHGQTVTAVAPSGGKIDTTETTIIAAPGAGKTLQLTELDIANGSTTGTEVIIRNGTGGPVIYRTFAVQAMGHMNIKFWEPIPLAVNTPLTAQCGTTATQTYINARGVILG